MESYSQKLKTKKTLSHADKQYLEDRDKPKFTYKEFKPYGQLTSCVQAAQSGKTINVDSFGRKYWIDNNPETGKFERVFCHDIGELKKIGKLRTAPGIAIEAQTQAVKLNAKKSKKWNKNQFVVNPASTKASCGAAESVGRVVQTGPRGGRYYVRKSKKTRKDYKVYCKG